MQTLALYSALVALVVIMHFWSTYILLLFVPSRYQLKQRALSKEKPAVEGYRFSYYKPQIIVSTAIVISMCVSGLVLLFQELTINIWAVPLTVIAVLLFALVLPAKIYQKFGPKIPQKLISIFGNISLIMAKPFSLGTRAVSGVWSKKFYSKSQLMKILARHADSDLGELTTDELNIISSAINYSNKKVADIMVPKKMVFTANLDDQVGPILMNELHKSGHQRFPVCDQKNSDEVAGILRLNTLVGDKKSGAVKKLMDQEVYYLHEDLGLDHALQAFSKTKHDFYIVIDKTRRFTGIVTVEDVITQILGRKPDSDFEFYDSLSHVSSLKQD